MQPRKRNRYGLRVPAIFFWKGARQTPHEGIGLTRDLSARGAFVFTTGPPPLKAKVKFKASPVASTGCFLFPIPFIIRDIGSYIAAMSHSLAFDSFSYGSGDAARLTRS